MGLFDFLKPKKKNAMAELLQKPAMRNAMAGMELEYLQKQVTNLRSVGRNDDAKKAVTEFLTTYAKEGVGAELTSRLDLARICYSFAYRTLPGLVYSRWSEFLDLWSGGVPFPMYVAIMESSDMGKRLTLDQIREFHYYQGEITSNLQYFLIAYPFPPERTEGPIMADLIAALAKGEQMSLDTLPVLGPFFSAVIFNSTTNEKLIYILGQSPGGGTTLRFVTAGGMNANCGPGPEPTTEGFLKAIKSNLKKQ